MNTECGRNMGNDLLVIPCDLPRGHSGECERNRWPITVNEQAIIKLGDARCPNTSTRGELVLQCSLPNYHEGLCNFEMRSV
jgi:hypothetical protein